MKHVFILCLAVLSISVFSFCNQYRSLSNATKVSQLNGNPFMYNLSKSLLKTTSRYLVEKGIQSAAQKLNLLTPLSSIITDPAQTSGFVSLLQNNYKIPSDKLLKNYSSLSTVRDLIYFVANNGRSFKFS